MTYCTLNAGHKEFHLFGSSTTSIRQINVTILWVRSPRNATLKNLCSHTFFFCFIAVSLPLLIIKTRKFRLEFHFSFLCSLSRLDMAGLKSGVSFFTC